MIKAIIVEDDPMVAQINKRYLDTASEIEVTRIFDNGRDALAYIRSSQPQLIVLDIYMPNLSGLELLKELRHENIQSDVIMVTAANDVRSLDDALKLGIVDYLVKPFEYERFMEAIAKFLKKADMLSAGSTLDQNQIDSLVNSEPPGKNPTHRAELKKGLQQRTLDLIRANISKEDGECTCEKLATAVGLSSVTVRRYLNFMVESGEIVNSVDYGTGGRPCMKYSINNGYGAL